MHAVHSWWKEQTRSQYFARLAATWLVPVLTVILIFTHRAVFSWMGMTGLAQSDIPIVLLMLWLFFSAWGSLELTARLKALYTMKDNGRVHDADKSLVDERFKFIGMWVALGAMVAIFMATSVLPSHIADIMDDASNGEEPDIFS